MELNVTKFVVKHSDCMEMFSDSVGRSGLDNIAQITWRNACIEMTDESNHFTDDLEALIDHFRGYGAWELDELQSMGAKELNAMVAQEVATIYQERYQAEERGELAVWEENWGGRLGTDGKEWHFYIGE